MTTKKTLEAVIAGGVLVVSMSASAQNLCSGAGSAAATFASGGFALKSVVPKCSANTYVSAKDNTASFALKSGSKKGRSYYGSNSDGGGVTLCTTFSTFDAGQVTGVADGGC